MKTLAKVSQFFSKTSNFYIIGVVAVIGILLYHTTSIAVVHASWERSMKKKLDEIQSLSSEWNRIDEQFLKNEEEIKKLQESNAEIKRQQWELSNQAREKRIEYVQEYGCGDKPEWCDLLKVEVVQKIEFRTNSEGRAKPLPKIEPTLEAFAKEYGLDAQDFIDAGNKWNVKPEVILCIARADSDLGRALKSKNNIWNVGNNDRWDTREFETIRDGIFAIGEVLNNKYQKNKETIQDLSRYGNCEKDCQYVYASSTENWENNVMNCLNFLYKNI